MQDQGHATMLACKIFENLEISFHGPRWSNGWTGKGSSKDLPLLVIAMPNQFNGC